MAVGDRSSLKTVFALEVAIQQAAEKLGDFDAKQIIALDKLISTYDKLLKNPVIKDGLERKYNLLRRRSRAAQERRKATKDTRLNLTKLDK